MKTMRCAAFAAFVVCTESAGLTFAQSFVPLGAPAGFAESAAFGISADGSTVVGSTGGRTSDYAAFKWTATNGFELLPFGSSDPSDANSRAAGVSADGSIVSGFISDGDGEAVIWAGGDVQRLPTSDAGRDPTSAVRLSDDGKVAAGVSFDGPITAFRWTSGSGTQTLTSGTDVGSPTIAYDLSADGSTVVGIAINDDPFIWTETGGARLLADFAGGARATGISGDGSVVAGWETAGGMARLWRWSEAEGVSDLASEPIGDPDINSWLSPSFDGSVIAGHVSGRGADESDAFIWTHADGFMLANDRLAALGVDLLNHSIIEIYDVSADGLTFTGTALDPNGLETAFIATIPAPGSTLAAFACAAALLRRRRN